MRATIGTPTGRVTCGSTDELLAAVAGEPFAVLELDELPPDVRRHLGLSELHLLGLHEPPPTYRIRVAGGGLEAVVPVADEGGCTPVYVVATSELVASVHRGPSIDLGEYCERVRWDGDRRAAAASFLFGEMALGTFRAAIREIRARLDDLEDDMVAGTHRLQLLELTRIHRRISKMRRGLGEYGDALTDVEDELVSGMELPEHVMRLAQRHNAAATSVLAELGGLRDEAANVGELHRSLTSTRQSLVINRLTVIAALLLPLTFVTGFFGMNFNWLVEHIESAAKFWLLGIATPIAVATVITVLMWRAGWLFVFEPDDDDRP